MADNGAANARFDALLADYETKILEQGVSSADQFFSARCWMMKNWPSEDIAYDDNLEPFLPIQGNGRLYYGGNQAWYPRSHHRRTACGAVALANIAAYAAHHHGLPQLYPYDLPVPLLQPQFLRHMEDVAAKLPPSIAGIPFTRYFIWGGDRYMASRGVTIAGWRRLHERSANPSGQLRTESFLQHHIRNNRPVACLHWGGAARIPVLNPGETPEDRVANMNVHWVVVTGIARREGTARVTVSSCGSRYVFPLDAFLRGAPSFVTPEFSLPQDMIIKGELD